MDPKGDRVGQEPITQTYTMMKMMTCTVKTKSLHLPSSIFVFICGLLAGKRNNPLGKIILGH